MEFSQGWSKPCSRTKRGKKSQFDKLLLEIVLIRFQAKPEIVKFSKTIVDFSTKMQVQNYYSPQVEVFSTVLPLVSPIPIKY